MPPVAGTDLMPETRTTAVITACLLAAACGTLPGVGKKPAPPEAPAATPEPAAPAPAAASARVQELERRLAQSELRLLERTAQVQNLESQLDEARQEVVRAMARVQSQASRAEAASAIAEAEIAQQSLRAPAEDAGAREVGRLVGLAVAEFDRRNYAGALYLAGQAKASAFGARGHAGSGPREGLREGESPFASALPLTVNSGANVREGPGTDFRVLFMLPAGAAVTGLSHTEEWMRISHDSGRTGWIHASLVGARR
jgi:hypothetical protein